MKKKTKKYKKIKLKGGVEVYIEQHIDSDTIMSFQTVKCKGCDANIIWGITVKNKKKIPIRYTKEGFICHFVDCPGASKFR